jgi:hypothetical protein
MVLSPESLTFRELGERCRSLADNNVETSVIECDRLICDIDQANDWGFITDGQSIELLKVVYQCRHGLMRREDALTALVRSANNNSIQNY